MKTYLIFNDTEKFIKNFKTDGQARNWALNFCGHSKPVYVKNITGYDLFEYHNYLPDHVNREIPETDGMTYDDCKQLQDKLNRLGYEFQFNLDAIPYNLHRI